jgi:hypothetical protein
MRNDYRDVGAPDNRADINSKIPGTSDYAAPEMIPLGTARSLIQGAYGEGWPDWGSGFKHNSDY